MDDARFKHRHIILSETSTPEKFTSPQGGENKEFKTFARDRKKHRDFLVGQLEKARKEFKKLEQQRKAAGIDENGITLTFRSEPGLRWCIYRER